MKNNVKKVDVPAEHFDLLFTPVACVVSITTVDTAGRVNAASFRDLRAGCITSPPASRFASTRTRTLTEMFSRPIEFVVNIPSFDREILEKVRTLGLPFAPGVNELEKAGLTAIPSKVVKPPRIAEYKSHFECRVEWTKEWFDTRLDGGRPSRRRVGR